MSIRNSDKFAQRLVDEGVVADREELDAVLDDRYGLSYGDVVQLDDLLAEYHAELRELNETYLGRAEELGLAKQFDTGDEPFPFESLLRRLGTAFLSPVSTRAANDSIEQLRELKKLHDEDALTSEEFDAAKSRLLDRL